MAIQVAMLPATGDETVLSGLVKWRIVFVDRALHLFHPVGAGGQVAEVSPLRPTGRLKRQGSRPW